MAVLDRETESVCSGRPILGGLGCSYFPTHFIPSDIGFTDVRHGVTIFLSTWAQRYVDGRDRAGLVPVGWINSVDAPCLRLAGVSEDGATIPNRRGVTSISPMYLACDFSGPLQR